MRIAGNSFRGEAPRVTPRALPENGAQSAINARLQSGDLESWRQFLFTQALATAAPETIYLLNGQWLSWAADVDVARGLIPGDNTYRIYITGPDLYDQPRFTNYTLATTGSEPFPVVTRPLGVPAPDAEPTLVAGVSSIPTSSTIEVLDNGDQLDTAWTKSPTTVSAFVLSRVTQSVVEGNAQPSYYLEADENGSFPAYLYRDFGVADSQVVEFSFDVKFGSEARRWMQAHVLASTTGAGIGIFWAENGFLSIGITSAWAYAGFSTLGQAAVGAPVAGTQYTCQGSVQINAAGTKTVRVGIYSGSAQIGSTITVTNAFVNSGGNFGFVLNVADDATTHYETWYDNILVRGTSPTAAITQIATSYVVTFVNDLGEESAPSPASATILKDDGTAITVTTQTSVPSGFSVDYAVETKRIYRAVTGNAGTIFAFVAEIPLAQADYVDELTDSQLGDALETELYDLPPDDLRGILALPNGIMVGFRRNQLCFSAQNNPHAWPVAWRLNTDTDIVAIGNIDNTVVIGTKAFPYTASGNDPSAYSMSKLEVKQACVSKRSLAYLSSIGVVYASPDGLVAISGPNQLRILTESVFTRRQWQALVPETILGVEHDDVYHFFSGVLASGGDTRRGFMLDMKGSGFGLAELGYHAGAAYADPLTDALYLALDAFDEPAEPYLPISSTFALVPAQVPTFSEALILLHLDGANGSAVFTDSSQYNRTVTSDPPADGLTLLSTAQKKFGTASLDLTAVSANHLHAGGSPAFNFASGDFTIAVQVYLTEANATQRGIISNNKLEDVLEQGWVLYVDTVHRPGFRVAKDNVILFNIVATTPVPVGGWALIVVVRVGDTYKLSVNGVVEATFTTATPIGTPGVGNPLAIGLDNRGLYQDWLGYIDEVMIADTALWTGDFTPPTEAFATLVDGSGVYEFDASPAEDLTYRYLGKLNRLSRPGAFTYCQVKAADYSNLLMNVYADGGLIFSEVLVSKEPFTLPMLDEYETCEIEFIGTSRVESYAFAETIEELE